MKPLQFCTALILTVFLACLPAARAGDFSTEYQREIAAQHESLSPDTLAQYREMRQTLAEKKRVIVCNDGCDALYYPNDLEFSLENFLGRRAAPLTQTSITTLSYCTISSGFSLFTHNTKIGEILLRDMDVKPNSHNITQNLLDEGTDTLRAVCALAHENGKECFWNFRMNDVHDQVDTPEKPFGLFPKLKKEHPDWLLGTREKHTQRGAWSSVNYAVPEIRDLAAQFVEEVCRNYDVDGIELDFCRHLCFFPGPADGGEASSDEIEMMNGLLRTIRRITDIEGMRRNRPILLTVRVPDDLYYSKKIGLDLDTWLSESLCDIVITSDYFQFNGRAYTAELGRRYHIPAYAGVSESRINDENRYSRKGDEAYRARFDTAWQAGVPGLFLFNTHDSSKRFLAEAPLTEELGTLDRCYFVTTQYGGSRPTSYLTDGDKYRQLPLLSPDTPVTLDGEPKTFPLELGTIPAPDQCRILLSLRSKKDAERLGDLEITVNGTAVKRAEINSQWPEWGDIPLETGLLRTGINTVTVNAGSGEFELSDIVIAIDCPPFE